MNIRHPSLATARHEPFFCNNKTNFSSAVQATSRHRDGRKPGGWGGCRGRLSLLALSACLHQLPKIVVGTSSMGNEIRLSTASLSARGCAEYQPMMRQGLDVAIKTTAG